MYKVIMSRSILDHFSKKWYGAHLADPRGPLSSKMLPSTIAAANTEVMCVMNGHIALQTDCEYCVTLVYKQAPCLLPASRHSCTHGDHKWKILYRRHSSHVNMCKVSHMRFSVGCCDCTMGNKLLYGTQKSVMISN